MNRPCVVTIASEKGGVGKTTIAINLAVYLKALREDLPVTIASFDNHFSVDQMFALGPRPMASITTLLSEEWDPNALTLGQYGVQYLASERRLTAPVHQPGWLRQRLHAADFDGILILDTRPILDWFTEAALLAADLVLVPVKDRAALVNAGALRQVLAGVNREENLWLIPSLVDTRSRLNADVKVHEFLRYAAVERDYQVLDIQISKSPKVESLASGFSSRILPVLTHARQTAVHGQLRRLAEFVLDHNARLSDRGSFAGAVGPAHIPDLPTGQLRRLAPDCPVCSSQVLGGAGHQYFDLRSRSRGFIHADCFRLITDEIELFSMETCAACIGFVIDGPGLIGPEPRLTAHLFDSGGALELSEPIDLELNRTIGATLAAMNGRPLEQSYHEFCLVRLAVASPEKQLSCEGRASFRKLRRTALRELRQAGYF